MDANLSVFKGDTLSFAVEIEGLDNQELERAYFTVKENKDDAEPLIQGTLGAEIWKIDATHYGVRIPPSSTVVLEPGRYFYDMQISLNGDTFTILAGKLIVKKDITED